MKDGDFASKTAISLGEFKTYIATTDDDKMLGEPVKFEYFDVREGA